MKHRFTGAELSELARLRRLLKDAGFKWRPVYGGRRYLTVAGWFVEAGALTYHGNTFTEAARRAIREEGLEKPKAALHHPRNDQEVR